MTVGAAHRGSRRRPETRYRYRLPRCDHRMGPGLCVVPGCKHYDGGPAVDFTTIEITRRKRKKQ